MPRLSIAHIWTPAFYDQIARYYDRIANWIIPEGAAAQRKLLDDLNQGALLDVGCGTGNLLAMAGERNLKTYGLDASGGMLAQACAKAPKAILIHANFYHLPFPDGCFDYVVESNALSSVDIAAERVLFEMLRVCKAGGQVRLADYAEPVRRSWRFNMYQWAGFLAGDYPYNYRRILLAMGYQPDVEIIGGHGMYQLIRVTK